MREECGFVDIQRSLQLLGGGLFALTVITGMCLPPGVVPSIVTVGLACATAVIFLAVLAVSLVKRQRLNGLVKDLIYAGLILVLVSGVVSYFFYSDALVEMSYGDAVVLNEDGYTFEFRDSNGADIENATFDVVLTDPDMVSYHETIQQSAPLKIDGINIHPMEVYEDGAVFLIEQNIFIKVMGLGGILFF